MTANTVELETLVREAGTLEHEIQDLVQDLGATEMEILVPEGGEIIEQVDEDVQVLEVELAIIEGELANVTESGGEMDQRDGEVVTVSGGSRWEVGEEDEGEGPPDGPGGPHRGRGKKHGHTKEKKEKKEKKENPEKEPKGRGPPEDRPGKGRGPREDKAGGGRGPREDKKGRGRPEGLATMDLVSSKAAKPTVAPEPEPMTASGPEPEYMEASEPSAAARFVTGSAGGAKSLKVQSTSDPITQYEEMAMTAPHYGGGKARTSGAKGGTKARKVR